MIPLLITAFCLFQLTRLLRGATAPFKQLVTFVFISTHTPLARRDEPNVTNIDNSQSFQLTRLLRGATMRTKAISEQALHFNSHASCEARQFNEKRQISQNYFNSHASCEARHELNRLSPAPTRFQLTRLLRGATCYCQLE